MTKLASIELITNVEKHPNADSLDVCSVLGYKAITKLGEYKIGDKVVFIQPDTVLPDQPWAQFYKAKSSRVKAIKLRQVWSQGIIEKPETVGLSNTIVESGLGIDISEIIGVTKYVPPEPQDLNAKGGLPFGLPITDEERFENLDDIPYGKFAWISRKMDGSSWTAYAAEKNGEWFSGICSRRLEMKLENENKYTKFKEVLPKLLELAKKFNKSIAVRGELTGQGIQSFKHNPDAQGEIKLSLFSVYLIDEHRYTNFNEELYYPNVAEILGLNTVKIVEKTIITPELIKKYSEDLTEIDGKPFEGVVVNVESGQSFKIINKTYDSKK